MTVNINNRFALSLTVLLFVLLSAVPTFSQKKNILRVRFETAKVKENVSDIVLNVFYKLETLRSPVNFRGYECRFSYEQTKIRPVTVFFDGTASQNGDGGGNNISSTGEYRVICLSSASLDTTNPILFQVRYSVKAFTDSAMIAPTRFDPVDATIDTVIIENAPGRDQVGWYPFGLLFRDTSKPTPKKVNITFSSDSADIISDSIREISVNVTSLDEANIKNGIFEFDLDTAAFDSVSVMKGLLLANASPAVGHDTSHIVVTFSSSVPILGNGELLKIFLRGKKRTDTLCSGILHPKFTALNDDNLLASTSYLLQGICVFGIAPKDTTTKGVTGYEESKDSHVTIYPNPSSSFVDFKFSPGSVGKKHLVMSDALGRVVLDRVLDADFRWDVASLPVGFYSASVSSLLRQVSEIRAEKTQIIIVH